MKFPIKLLDDLVAVQYSNETQIGSIILPDWKRSLHGKVLARGPKATEVRVRDTVTFGAAKGMESVLSGIPIRILREEDIDIVIG